MAVTADQVIVELQAKIAAYMNNVNRAERQWTRSMSTIDRSGRATAGRIEGYFRTIATGLAGRAALEFINAAQRINNALRIAGLEGAELGRVYDSLFVSAQRNAVPLEALTELYTRASLAQKELKASSADLLRFTENVATALRVAGKSAEESRGALLQLSQAIGSGVVRAEEFNSILEGALPIAQAAAAGLEEAGGSVAKLRKLIIDGKVSSEAFFRAFEAGSVILKDKVADAQLTVAQQFTRLQNVLVDSAGRLDEAYGITKTLGGGLEDLARDVGTLTQFFVNSAGPIQEFITLLGGAIAQVQLFAENANRAGFLDKAGFDMATFANNLGLPPELLSGTSVPAGRVVEGTFRILAETPQDDALAAALVPGYAAQPKGPGGRGGKRGGGTLKPVSLSDFALPDVPGRGGKKSPEEKFSDALRRVQDMTAATQRETETVNLNTFAKEKARVQEQLLNDARDAGVKMSPEVVASIDAASTAYAQAAEQAKRVTDEQQRQIDGIREFQSLTVDVLGGFISDLREGVDAAEALGNVFDKLADKLIDIAIQNLVGAAFGMLLGGPAGGVTGIGSLIGGLFGGPKGFASGTPNTGGTRGMPAGIVHGQEAVIPLPSGGKVPVDIRGGGANDFIMVRAVTEVVNGNLVPVITDVSGQVAGRALKTYDAGLASRTAESEARYK